MRDKLNLLMTVLTQKKEVEFYLYNVIYIIYNRDNKFIIRQLNSNLEYVYDDLKILFESYRIYGQSLAECFDNVRVIED